MRDRDDGAVEALERVLEVEAGEDRAAAEGLAEPARGQQVNGGYERSSV